MGLPSRFFGLRSAIVVAIILIAAIVATQPAAGQIVRATESGQYAEARATLEARQFGQAATRFAAFRRAYPRSPLIPDALYHEGSALLAIGRSDDAVSLLVEFEDNHPGHPLAFEARIALGQYYYANDEPQNAITTLSRVLDRRPPAETAARALYWMGDSAVRLGRDNEALLFYQRAASDYPETATAPQALYARAFMLVRLTRYEEGAAAFELLAARYPASDLSRNVGLALAEVYYEIGDYSRTIVEIRRRFPSLGADGKDRANFLLAECYNQLRDSENAIVQYRLFTEAGSDGPYYRRAVYGLAWNYYHEGAHQWAADEFARIADGTDALGREALYYEGVNLSMSARPRDAADRFSRYAEMWPDEPLADHALYELGVVLFSLRQWEEAGEAFERLTDRYSDSDLLGEAYRFRGNTYIATGDFDRALMMFDEAIALDAIDPNIRDAIIFQKAWLLYRTEEYAASADAFDALHSSNPRGPEAAEALFWAAESHFQRDRLDAAAERFRSYIGDYPGAVHIDAAHYALGWTYFRQQRYEAAIPQFERFLASYREAGEAVPYRADAQLRLADSYYALKRYGEAVRVYGRLVADGDDYALYQIGQAYANAGDPLAAIRSFQRLITEFPDSEWRDEARYSLGYLFFQNQEYDQAITEYRNLIRDYGASPLAAKAQYGIGDAHFNAGRLDQAVSAYSTVLNRYPSSPFASDAAAGIQFALIAGGEEDRALALIDSFAIANPGSPLVDELRFRRAEVRYQSGQVDGALDDLLRFVRSAENENLLPEAYFYLGTIYSDRGRNDEAVNYLGQIVERYPDSPRRAEAASRLGRLYLESGRYEQAESTFEQLAAAAPENARRLAEARYGRSMALLGIGRTQEAEALLQELVAAAPDAPETAPAYLGLGRLREQAGQAPAAISHYRTASAGGQDESAAEALYRLGSLLRRSGNPAGAIEELSRMPLRFAGYTDWMARGYLEQARALAEMGREGEAVRMYDQVIELYPQHGVASEAARERAALERD